MKILLALNLCQGSIRQGSPVSCENAYGIINNIINISSEFDRCYVINDYHESCDAEFNYLPQHMVIGTEDVYPLYDSIRAIKTQNLFLCKNTLDAIHKPHNKSLVLYDANEIVVAGFCGFDITATCLSLISEGKKISLIDNCIGDLNQDIKQKTLDYLKFLGIEIR